MELAELDLPLEAVAEARRRIAPFAVRTPVVRLDGALSGGGGEGKAEAGPSPGPEIWLKLENLQPIGSFKLRGAASVMTRREAGLREGVLTASAGNMAQGVAYCARRMGIPATIIAPDSAPATKIEAVRRLGGRVIQVPFATWWRCFETRSFPGVAGSFIHAFDDLDVMAGNGTIALELIEDLAEIDAVVVPWGGGGLACGIASVLRQVAPGVKVYAAEVETAAPLAAALAKGEPVEVAYEPSFVDGIGSRKVFAGMLARAQHLLAGSLVVTLEQARTAMRLAAERNRVILEGAACCAVAAAAQAGRGRVVAIASGGNIDLDRFGALCLEPGGRP